MSFFLTIIYFSILFFFGWQLVHSLLKENRIEYLLGLGGISGIGLYVFSVNALGYFVPIKIAFYSVLSLFFLIGLGLFYFNEQKSLNWEINRKWRKILLGTALFLVVTGGIIAFRFPFVPYGGGPLMARTIAEGNFPPVEIWAPEQPFYYHYAPELFAAAIHKVTGLPLYLAYDFQVAILSGILFLLGFILIKQFCQDNFKAFISSLLMLYSGTLVFLNGIKGIPIFYKIYILHQQVPAPFKFVSDAFDTEFAVPALKKMVENPWSVSALPLIIAVIFLYFYLVDRKAHKAAFLLPGILLAFLALNAETYFAVLCSVLLVYPFAFLLIKRDREKFRKFLVISCLVLMVALPLAFFQGGILKGVLLKFTSGGDHYASFFTTKTDGILGINKTPWIFYNTAIYNLRFLSEWGLLFILLIPSFVYLFKKYFQLGLFLAVSIIVFFSVPFLITFNNSYMDGQMIRIFYPINLLGGLVVGLWLKRATLFMVIVLMAQCLLFQLAYLSIAIPSGTWNAAEIFFAKENSPEGKAYDWVKKNTTIKDYFLIVMKESEYGSNNSPNYRFILNAGRMAPIYTYYNWFDYYGPDSANFPDLPSGPEPALFKEVRENCNSEAVKNLKYGYLYVNEKWKEGLEEKCLANNGLELKFEAKEGDEFVRIYKVL